VQLLETLQNLDEDVLHVINHAGSNVILDCLMTVLTVMGISFVMATFAVFLWMRGRKDDAIDYLVLVALVSVLVEAIKIVTDRDRPLDALPDVNTISILGLTSASGPSFPSGHAARAFAVAALLSFGRGPRFYGASFVLAAGIALSRIYLGLHWPSDVLFGALLGVIGALLLRSYARPDSSYGRARTNLIRFFVRPSISMRSKATSGCRKSSRFAVHAFVQDADSSVMTNFHDIGRSPMQPLYRAFCIGYTK
jgi:undecaprenyl-diphosphatase